MCSIPTNFLQVVPVAADRLRQVSRKYFQRGRYRSISFHRIAMIFGNYAFRAFWMARKTTIFRNIQSCSKVIRRSKFCEYPLNYLRYLAQILKVDRYLSWLSTRWKSFGKYPLELTFLNFNGFCRNQKYFDDWKEKWFLCNQGNIDMK